MTYLLNAAVITAPGTYVYKVVRRADMVRLLQDKTWESRIGYPETARHVESLCGLLPELSREPVVMAPGDEALVVRLKYRLSNPALKAAWKPSLDDWEYGHLIRTA